MADYRRALRVLLILLALIGVAGCCPPWTGPRLRRPIRPLERRSNEALDGAVTPGSWSESARRNRGTPIELKGRSDECVGFSADRDADHESAAIARTRPAASVV
jgi:hypothetical protein